MKYLFSFFSGIFFGIVKIAEKNEEKKKSSFLVGGVCVCVWVLCFGFVYFGGVSSHAELTTRWRCNDLHRRGRPSNVLVQYRFSKCNRPLTAGRCAGEKAVELYQSIGL